MKKKKWIILGMAVLLGTAPLSACHSADKQTQEENKETEEKDGSKSQNGDGIHIVTDDSTDPDKAEETKEETKKEVSGEASSDESAELFKELSDWNFEFSSGAGAWSTELKIEADGSFTGSYHDSDMGTTGEGYPDGTVYLCNFSGKFAPVQKVNDYTYKTKLEKLESKEKEGKEELADGMKFVYSTPYGLAEAEDIYIYTKGAPADKLPQEYQDWVMFPLDGAKTLPFYGLYNEKEQLGFYSWDASDLDDTESGITADVGPGSSAAAATVTGETGSDSMDGIMDTLNKTAKLEERLQKENLTQEEMNELSDELYKAWDAQLNTTWKQLKRTLDADTMKTITKEQREWLKERDKKMEEAGKGYEGGSIQSMLISSEGAELTKTRVYELFEYLR